MEFFQNPNLIYLLLAGGLALVVLSLAAPGTGILELLAIGMILLAGVAILYFQIPINLWALLLLLVGAVLFYQAVRRPRPWPLLIISTVLIALGSVYLFEGDSWFLPAVNPLLAAVVSTLLGGFFWVAGRKIIEASTVRPAHDLGTLIGAIGEAKTEILAEGSALVAGELWSVRSKQPIPAGARVRVTGREGFILDVEAVE